MEEIDNLIKGALQTQKEIKHMRLDMTRGDLKYKREQALYFGRLLIEKLYSLRDCIEGEEIIGYD